MSRLDYGAVIIYLILMVLFDEILQPLPVFETQTWPRARTTYPFNHNGHEGIHNLVTKNNENNMAEECVSSLERLL